MSPRLRRLWREEEEYEYDDDDDDDDDEYYDEDSSEEYDENYDENSEDDSEEKFRLRTMMRRNSSESEEDAFNVTHTKIGRVKKSLKQRPNKNTAKNNTIIIHIRSSRVTEYHHTYHCIYYPGCSGWGDCFTYLV